MFGVKKVTQPWHLFPPSRAPFANMLLAVQHRHIRLSDMKASLLPSGNKMCNPQYVEALRRGNINTRKRQCF